MTPKLKSLLLVTGVMLGLDQATKIWTQQAFSGPFDKKVIIPRWLDFVHAENEGAAFSAFADFPASVRLTIFGAFTVLAVGALIQMFRQLGAEERLRAASIGFILSGALGNAIDRIYKQSVTDFVKVYWGQEGAVRDWLIGTFGTNIWPIWNVADAAIFIGLGMFLLEYFFEKDEAPSGALPDNPVERESAAG